MKQKMKQAVVTLALQAADKADKAGMADRALKSSEVQEMTGLSRSTIHRMESCSPSLFPRRFKIGAGRRVAWSMLEIQEWLSSRPRVELKG